MSYIAHSLSPGEAVLYEARFPWLYRASAGVSLIALAITGAIIYALGYGWAGSVCLLAGIASFIAIMLPIWTTEIGVTNQRLIYKRGLFWRTTQELQLRAVEEVVLDQSVAGRLLDFGRLELHGTGVGDVRLPTLTDPIGLRRALQEGMAATQVVSSPTQPRPSTVAGNQQTA